MCGCSARADPQSRINTVDADSHRVDSGASRTLHGAQRPALASFASAPSCAAVCVERARDCARESAAAALRGWCRRSGRHCAGFRLVPHLRPASRRLRRRSHQVRHPRRPIRSLTCTSRLDRRPSPFVGRVRCQVHERDQIPGMGHLLFWAHKQAESTSGTRGYFFSGRSWRIDPRSVLLSHSC